MPRVIRHALVFGARGQIGCFLLPRLLAHDIQVHAVTRTATVPHAGPVRWHRVDLFEGADLALDVDAVFSAGPLDGFAAWWRRSALRPAVVIAFGSTSVAVKRASADVHERAIAARLAQAEQDLATDCRARGVAWTVLRPTLIYGAGMDRSLSRIARAAQRFGALPLPHDARGLRQPVHADDLAAAALAAAHRDGLLQPAYDLPGGETLNYREMVQRVLDCLDPPRRVVPVPGAILRAMLALARGAGVLREPTRETLRRMHADLVFDAHAARDDLGFEPRRFRPDAAMFVAPETA